MTSGVLWGISVTLIAAVVTFRGWRLPGSGLDPSWHLVLEHAYLNSWTFGRDLIFTFGPWGLLYTKLFHEQLWGYMVVFDVLVLAIWAVYFWRFRGWSCLVFLPPLLLTVGFGAERILVVVPLMAFWLVANRTPFRWTFPFWLMTAWVANTKFTFMVVALALAVAADLMCLESPRRQPPVHTVMVIALVWLMFLAAGQPVDAWFTFVRESLDLAAGYGQAMNKVGSWTEMGLFCLMSAGYLAFIAAAVRQMPFSVWRRLISILAVAGVVFVMFRAGFTRHDGHSLMAWGALASIIATTAVALRGENMVWHAPAGQLAVLLLVVGIAGYYKLNYTRSAAVDHSVQAALLTPLQRRVAGLADYWRPGSLEVHQRRGQARITVATRDFADLQPVGTVDVIPWNASIPILSGWDYRPRPVFQSYAAYTQRQQYSNREFLEAGGADTIFFTAAQIDGRWPGSSLGLSLVSLLTHYDLTDESALGHVLRRRSSPRVTKAVNLLSATSAPGDWVDLPASSKLIAWSADLRPTLAGRLTSLFVNPVIVLEAELSDGRTVQHRIVPEILRSGTVISPYVSKATSGQLFEPDFRAGTLGLPSVERVRLQLFPLTEALFSRAYSFRLDAIEVTGEREYELAEQLKHRRSDLEALSLLALAARRWDGKTPTVMKSASGKDLLDAHGGSRFLLEAQGLSSIRFNYGIRSGAWEQGKTNGVRFQVLLSQGDGRKESLLDRVLDPLQFEQDRPEQSFVREFDRPITGSITIIVTTNGDPRWDWSYLADAGFEAERVCVQDKPLQCRVVP